jgi:hypothetical protein
MRWRHHPRFARWAEQRRGPVARWLVATFSPSEFFSRPDSRSLAKALGVFAFSYLLGIGALGLASLFTEWRFGIYVGWFSTMLWVHWPLCATAALLTLVCYRAFGSRTSARDHIAALLNLSGLDALLLSLLLLLLVNLDFGPGSHAFLISPLLGRVYVLVQAALAMERVHPDRPPGIFLVAYLPWFGVAFFGSWQFPVAAFAFASALGEAMH